MSLPTVSIHNSLRNRIAVRLANLALRIADEDYRAVTKAAIYLGWATALEAGDAESPAQPSEDD